MCENDEQYWRCELKSIKVKTLFVLGDQDDSVPLECIEASQKNFLSQVGTNKFYPEINDGNGSMRS